VTKTRARLVYSAPIKVQRGAHSHRTDTPGRAIFVTGWGTKSEIVDAFASRALSTTTADQIVPRSARLLPYFVRLLGRAFHRRHIVVSKSLCTARKFVHYRIPRELGRLDMAMIRGHKAWIILRRLAARGQRADCRS